MSEFVNVWSGAEGDFVELMINDTIIPITVFQPTLENCDDPREGKYLLFADTGEGDSDRDCTIYYAPINLDCFVDLDNSVKPQEKDFTMYPYFLNMIVQFMDVHYDPSDT